MSELAEENVLLKGSFGESLIRNNKKIRSDRAEAIIEDAQMVYKRKIEDLEQSVKKLRRERENMIDLSPTSADSLMLATDFDAQAFTNKDIDLGVKIRENGIKLEIAKTQYEKLFGEKI